MFRSSRPPKEGEIVVMFSFRQSSRAWLTYLLVAVGTFSVIGCGAGSTTQPSAEDTAHTQKVIQGGPLSTMPSSMLGPPEMQVPGGSGTGTGTGPAGAPPVTGQ